MSTELHLLMVGADADDEARAALAFGLRAELDEVADVRPGSASAPPGSKAGSAFEWAGLIVTLTGTLPVVMSAIESWLARRRDDGATGVILKLGDDEITLHSASDAEQRELLDAFLERHVGE